MVEVYKRANSPFWYFDMSVDGERKRCSTRRTLKGEAKAVAQQMLKEALDKAQFKGKEEITVRQALFDHYLPTRKAEGCASHVHLKRYAEYLCGDRKDIKGVGKGGDQPLSGLTDAMLRTYRNQRVAAGMSLQSVDHELKALSAACNLVKRDYLVASDLTWPLARVKGKARFLTAEEETALFEELDPTRIRTKGGGWAQIAPLAVAAKQRQDNYDLAVMLLDTGCRFGEIAKLTWLMVDTADWRTIHIWRTKVEKHGGDAVAAELTITKRMKEVLQRRHAGRKNGPYVFPIWSADKTGGKVGTAAIRKAMARVGINSPENVQRFGRRDVRSFRDTFATKVVKHVGLYGVQKLLGHSTPAMSQKYAFMEAAETSGEAAAFLDKLQ